MPARGGGPCEAGGGVTGLTPESAESRASPLHHASDGPPPRLQRGEALGLPAARPRPLVQVEAAPVDRSPSGSPPRSSPPASAICPPSPPPATARTASSPCARTGSAPCGRNPTGCRGWRHSRGWCRRSESRRGFSRTMKSPERSGSKLALARWIRLQLSGGPDGAGAAASSALVNTAATWGWRL